ncbi:MAG: hypothetical protein KDK44_06640 [Chlamydiia bacterium]|nr:hypothetical protein [Chlamydiia bacterium]
MHFALLNASRVNTKPSEDAETKKKSPSTVDQATTNSTTSSGSQNASSTTSNPNDAASGSSTTSSTSNGTPSTSTNPKLQNAKNVWNWAMTADVETTSWLAICVVLLMVISMFMPGQQMKGLGQVAEYATKVSNDLTEIMGFFSSIEEGSKLTGLGPSFFSGAQGDAGLQNLEKACAAVADLFYSNPNNPSLESQGVSYQGATYVPILEWDQTTKTCSIAWVNLADASSLTGYAKEELTNPASDLQMLMCADFQYLADCNYTPENLDSGPPAATLQGEVNQSFSALKSLMGFASQQNNTYKGWSMLQYMVTVGVAVNNLQTGVTFKVISETKVDSYLDSKPAMFGVNAGHDIQDLTQMLNNWAIGYAKNNDPADSTAFQQGSSLDQWYTDLQNVQTTATSKMQDVTIQGKKLMQEYQNNDQICQSAIKSEMGFRQVVNKNSLSQNN